jgi:hypothetical protein
VSMHKWFFRPISALCSKNNPRNIKHIPACPGTSTGWLFFSHVLILNKNPHLCRDTKQFIG